MEQRIFLERELNILRDHLHLMGGEVELERRDSDVANQVIENDRVIDLLELEI